MAYPGLYDSRGDSSPNGYRVDGHSGFGSEQDEGVVTDALG